MLCRNRQEYERSEMKVYYEAKSPVSNEDILEGASITADRFAWDKKKLLWLGQKLIEKPL